LVGKTGPNLVKYQRLLDIHNFIFFSKRKNVLTHGLHGRKNFKDIHLWVEINNHSILF